MLGEQYAKGTIEMMIKLLPALVLSFACAFGTSSAAYAIPFCQPCPYDCDDIGDGLGDKDCSEVSDNGSTCCVDLTEWGLQLAQAEAGAGGGSDDDDEECPDGFEESENKCSPDEREDGCRDIRLDNGTGCVSR